jgi:hypothetical protein
MKKHLVIIALIIVASAQVLAQYANAARKHHRSTGQGEACTYAGYPCSQWNQMRDRW